jgi:hypothetical protein
MLTKSKIKQLIHWSPHEEPGKKAVEPENSVTKLKITQSLNVKKIMVKIQK